MYEEEMRICIHWIESHYGIYAPTKSDAIHFKRLDLGQTLDRYCIAKQTHTVLYEQFRKERMDEVRLRG